MTAENGVRGFAGIMILISVLLGACISKWWLLFTGFTGFCPAAMLLKKLGLQG